MERLLPVSLVALVVIGLLTLMLLAWRRRVARAAGVTLPSSLDSAGDALGSLHELFYVATTLREAPLERVAIRGLRFRGFASLTRYEAGILIEVRGEAPCALSREQITSVTTQQLTIDKVVEPAGLISINWLSELGELSSVFRVKDANARATLLALPTRLTQTHTNTAQENL